MRACELRHGPLADVADAVDAESMDTDDLRSVILNLIDHIEQLEKAAERPREPDLAGFDRTDFEARR